MNNQASAISNAIEGAHTAHSSTNNAVNRRSPAASRNYFRTILSLSLIALLSGCSQSKDKEEGNTIAEAASKTSVQAAAKIESSFGIVNTPDPLRVHKDKKNNLTVAIKRDALEKEFLLDVSITYHDELVPSFFPLKSRVIAFRLRGDRLFMLEGTQGHTVSSDIPKTLLITSFPVISENAQEIIFDFNQGMSEVALDQSMFTSEVSSSHYQNSTTSKSLAHTYLEKALISGKDNTLYIEQVGQLKQNFLSQSSKVLLGQSHNESIELRYYLQPYRPSSDFIARRAPRHSDQVNFFEAHPILTANGKLEVNALKINENKPFVFALSSNTPKEFRQAIQEGVLYWNHVLGKPLLEVEDAPDDLTAPNHEYNIIQWIDHDFANGAYAQLQFDPRTGEVRHAQIYFPRSFATNSKQHTYWLLKSNHKLARQSSTMSVEGFETQELCNLTFEDAIHVHSFVNDDLNISDAPEEIDVKRLKEIAKDRVRKIIAHEVGHILGLRHNFAGSLFTNLSLAKHEELLKTYLLRGEFSKDAILSSSVMDYSDPINDALVGAQVSMNPSGFAYDAKALGFLYERKKLPANNDLLYCSDAEAIDYNSSFIDCRLRDFGSSSLEYNGHLFEQQFKKLPEELIAAFRSAKSPEVNEEDEEPIRNVNFNIEAIATQLITPRHHQVLQIASKKFANLSVFRNFPAPFDKTDVQLVDRLLKSQFEFSTKEIQKLGGLQNILSDLPENYGKQLTERFNYLINLELYRHWKDINGQKLKFTDEDILAMKEKVSELSKTIDTRLATFEISSLRSLVLPESNLDADLASIMEKKAEKYVLSLLPEEDSLQTEYEFEDKKTDPSTGTVINELKKIKFKLPKFQYNTDVRMGASMILLAGRSEKPGWGTKERRRLKIKLEELLDSKLAPTGKKFKDLIAIAPKLRPELREWLLDNADILSYLYN